MGLAYLKKKYVLALQFLNFNSETAKEVTFLAFFP